MNDEEYNGWTNHETWATALHWGNNESLYNHYRGAMKELDNIRDFAAWIKDETKNLCSTAYWWAEFGRKRPDEVRMMADEIGDLQRVNWDELAAAWLEEN